MNVPPRHVACAAVLLLLLTAGCASVTPDPQTSPPEAAVPQPAATPSPEVAAAQPAATPPPTVVATQPAAPAPPKPAPAALPAPSATPPPSVTPAPGATTTAPPAPAKVAPPVARTPAPVARAPQPAAPPVAAPPVVAPPAPAAPLDLKALTEELKATRAIGIFTKISLKNKVDDLLQQFREYYQGKTKITLAQLRQSYNLLMMKVLSLLQDADQKLASAIVSSREAIWALLADQTTFAALQS